MQYRSIATLNRQIIGWLADLPRDTQVVVGVPRSGLLVANLLALHLNLPLTDVDGLLAGRSFGKGERGRGIDFSRPINVLVVDDSVRSGSELARVRRRISEAGLPHNIRYAAPYVAPGTESSVDHFLEVVGVPRIFEWNVMHHSVLLTSCVDIDGVLCADPSKEQNDDGDAYLQFLAQARPLIVPTVPVGWLVTSRLEKYRDQTERWLAANGVQYRELVMMNAPTRQHRVAAGSHAPYKAQFYCDSGADLFIESEASLALEICELSGKPVFCAETREMVYPTSIGPSRHKGVGTRGANESSVRAAPAGVSDWTSRLQAGIRQALELVRPGRSFILLDQEQWGLSDSFAGRRRIPFPQSDGLYSGPPADGPAALRELATALSADAEYFVIGWPAYWWLDHYPGFAAHLESRFRCVIRNELLTAYELRPAGSESRRQQCSNVLTEDPLISGA